MGNVLIDSGKNRYLSLYNIFGSLVRNVLTNGSFISKDDNIFGT